MAWSTGDACGFTLTRSRASMSRKSERRHQGDHGGRRGLMAADLEVVTFRPLAVRIVDDPGGEPEHPALDRGHCLEISGRN